jgi:pyrroloquinoline quinone biosynthesis protein B
LIFSCNKKHEKIDLKYQEPYILILGTAQDAGYPQIACEKECCQRVYENLSNKRFVSSIAIVDPISNESWIFDATPDFTAQTKILSKHLKESKQLPDGIFLTHGHIGHYTGLMYLGREAMNAQKMPVFTMPRMHEYLTNNGPWSQLVELNNISLKSIQKDSTIVLNKRISVIPIQVPHRDEFTETVGFIIKNENKKALFIPDIDKWSKWGGNIVDYIKEVDIAILDATFFKNGEINRDMNQVPHPFVEESMKLFKNLSDTDKKKVYFIHFNHTNPLLIDDSEAQKIVKQNGFNVAKQEMVIPF